MITVTNTVKAPLAKVWNYYTEPQHIVKWNNPSEDWHTPKAVNDLRVGGAFCFTMAAKDGSMSFDFEGTYTAIKENALIEYVLADNRKIIVTFEETPHGIFINESFDPETQNPEEMQRQGWQNVLDSFKKYTEQ